MLRQILTILVMIALTAHAGINSGLTDGWLSRGDFYYDAKLNAAAIDQLIHYNSISDPTEQSDLRLAITAARDAAPGAVNRLEKFLADYPYSPARQVVAMTIGNCYMDARQWEKAYRTYAAIGDKSLDRPTNNLRLLNMGIALMYQGKFSDADKLFTALNGTSQAGNARYYRGYIAYVNHDYNSAKTLLEGVTGNTMPAAMAPYYLCQIYYTDGNNDKALSTARKLLGNNNVPSVYKAEASRIAGEALYNLGEADRAIPYLNDYLKECSDEPLPSALYILGMCQYRTANYHAAIETLKTPAQRDDAMAQSALLTIGQSYMHLGETTPALIALNRAVQLDCEDSVTEESLYNYCVAQSDGGRLPFSNSVSTFETFAKRFPNSHYTAKVSEYLAFGYINDDNYEAALASLNKIKDPTAKTSQARQHVLYTLGSRDLAAGNLDSALRYLNEAATMPNADKEVATECLLLIADCRYKKGEYNDAIKNYTDYLTRTSSSGANHPVALYNLGYALFAQKQYDKAAGRFEQLLDTRNLSHTIEADANCRLGDCAYANRNLDRALRHYDKAIHIDPATADYPMYQRAIIEGWKGNDNALIEGLNSMIARFPKSPLVPQALLDIAEVYSNDNRTSDALIVYRRIENDYPQTAQCRQALLLMGALQASSQRPDEAYDTYSRLISKHSPSAEAFLGARNMQSLAAELGYIDRFVDFMKSVPNAPEIDPAELDRATFGAAHTPAQWEKYIEKFPTGNFVPQALLLLAQDAASHNDNDRAISYASRLYSNYPNGELAAKALSIKADAELELGQIPQALESYRLLEERASSPTMLNHSRMGLLKTSRDMGRHDDVITLADMLLSSSSLGTGQQDEVKFIKANALAYTQRGDQAVEIWRTLAANPTSLIGSKSLYYTAQHFYDNGNTAAAWQAVEKLVDSNTPHSYWLARGYILMSDLYRERGDKFEAEEYLKSLRSNYPGSEPDIQNMIELRLNNKNQ